MMMTIHDKVVSLVQVRVEKLAKHFVQRYETSGWVSAYEFANTLRLSEEEKAEFREKVISLFEDKGYSIRKELCYP